MKKLFLLLVAVVSASLFAMAQTRTVQGTVVDASSGEPLIGVSVVPTGSDRGVVTDIDGNFRIQVGENVKTLTFSYVGFKSLTAPVQPVMNVSLETSSETLEQLVVTGYGSGKKLGSVVGSVAVIGSASLENITTPSFVDALQGKVAGLSVASSSGDPSSTRDNIRLRGVNSINSDLTPLFILDGAPVTQTVFSTLNPNDIESITVLKDAASVAVYGSRAANGVIVITSKKGKYAEKARINIRAKYGWSQMASEKIDMMNSAQNLKYREITGRVITDEMRYAVETLGIDTKWRDEIFNGHAPTYSLEASVTGGSEVSDYYLSVNHLDQDGIVAQSKMRRETLRASLSSRVTDWLRVGFQANLGYTKYQTNGESNAIYSGDGVYITNPMVTARKALPMDSPYYWTKDENGNIVWGDKAEYLHFSGMPTPDYVYKIRDNWTNRVTANANLWEQITPIRGLTIRFQQSMDAYDQRVTSGYYPTPMEITPMGDVIDMGANDEGLMEGSNNQSFGRYYQFTYTNTVEYRTKFNDVHNVSVLVGEESIYKKSNSFGVYVDGYTDSRLQLLPQGTFDNFSSSNVSQSITEASMNSIFVNGSYDYSGKYFLELNLRRDGSSYYAPEHRWATFWSAGLMWDIKSEKFANKYTWLDQARLRVSYGTTGNSSFANYAYFGLVGAGGSYNGATSLGIAQPKNTDLTWETVAGLDVGLHVGLFHKLDLDLAFYSKDTRDMIVEVPYSLTTGFSGNWGNIASMRNTGIDVDFSVTAVQTRDWLFEIHGNLNYNRNRITKLFNGLDEVVLPNTGLILKKGHVCNEFYMVKWAGVDPRDGAPMWYTKEGNLTKVYNEERDAVSISNHSSYSPIGGGFGFQGAWKGLQLICDFTWAAKKYMTNNDRYFIENNNFGSSFNQMVTMLDVWTTPGQVTDIPAVGYDIQFDSHVLEDASYMRLKNLTLQYSFPRKWIQKAQITDLRVHFTGRNLLTFTGYTGYDPEPESNVVTFYYPNTRQYEFGIDVSF